MADETREFLLEQRETRGERARAITQQEYYEAITARAHVARLFYEQLLALGFTSEEAVVITAGQSF